MSGFGLSRNHLSSSSSSSSSSSFRLIPRVIITSPKKEKGEREREAAFSSSPSVVTAMNELVVAAEVVRAANPQISALLFIMRLNARKHDRRAHN